ncbi:hypothetical protein [Serratia ureilytica]|uniref:hypothetical protein n=1 Tax=Serratia ureilytica TaxID=300181 RepID=UPI0018D7ADCA|nr:hypothetical protein [Serratia ureilytica]MBH2759606.1 hypothetical protein [Serratia ureilytica]
MTLTTEQLRAIAEEELDACATLDSAKLMARELLANREAQPVAYFAAAPDYGWDMFKNKEDAIATCQAEIDAYRDCRDDGWDDDVQRVCWGVVMQKAEGFDLQGLHTSNSNHTYQTCDYSLHPVTATATPTPAVNASQDFEAWFVEKYKQPERLVKNEDGTYKFSGVQMAFSAWSDGRAAMLAQPVSSGYTLPGCEWTYDDNDSKWDSACGEAWMFSDGGPTENGVKFCQGCGKPVLLAAAPEGGNG